MHRYIIVFPNETANPITSNNNTGLEMQFGLTHGSNHNGGEGRDGWSAYAENKLHTGASVNLYSRTTNNWYLTGVQLEAGDVATPFEHLSYGEELALCHRYYQFIDGTSDQITFGPGRCNGTTLAEVTIPLSVPLAVSPTLTCTQNGCWDSDGGHTSTDAPTVRLWNKNTATLAVVFGGHSGLTNARACVVTCSNNSDFIMDAELV